MQFSDDRALRCHWLSNQAQGARQVYQPLNNLLGDKEFRASSDPSVAMRSTETHHPNPNETTWSLAIRSEYNLQMIAALKLPFLGRPQIFLVCRE